MDSEDMVHIHNRILLSHKKGNPKERTRKLGKNHTYNAPHPKKKKNEIMPFAATQMQLETLILRKRKTSTV